MASSIGVYYTSALIYTGKGVLTGLVVTSNTGAPQITLWDNDHASGTKLFDAYVAADNILIIFFPDEFAPRFTTGLYISLQAGMLATVWIKTIAAAPA